MSSTILVTGGAGYIGSHTVLELLSQGDQVIVVDNLSNASEESLERVKKITGKHVVFFQADILDKAALSQIFKHNHIDAVIHFAGLKAVGESTQIPLTYYHNNVTGTITLCQVMAEYNVKSLVFSSSATVYGDPQALPLVESMPTGVPTNAYGHSKLMIEEILRDLSESDPSWRIAILRYFNPIGAHESGLIGEDPNGIPNNLMPFITQVAVGRRDKLSIFGNDYNTKDGTGVRDYIHVVDLALGHLKALEKLKQSTGVFTYNLGTGVGYSVLEMATTFEQVSGQPVPYQIIDRRPGDIAACYADATAAKNELNWTAQFDLQRMCEDSWRWQKNNPNGFKG
ncbi:UDP-glucose 4-epimerase GalE [Catenovulum sp. 2E275]|uniref:UDP-glucose 4-epimerase GalE n=1 Tax=Catenovulum sp. 2E275 TaxID=2980497 RepID=UPI0021D11E29|nr:UDP-glucose 4-epimerase GalE [Catenovulum sp. 2E275]MCU4677455.1 UDP-glucose 4-epimerase GalE [Catenovulum sp. 2E275]